MKKIIAYDYSSSGIIKLPPQSSLILNRWHGDKCKMCGEQVSFAIKLFRVVFIYPISEELTFITKEQCIHEWVICVDCAGSEEESKTKAKVLHEVIDIL